MYQNRIEIIDAHCHIYPDKIAEKAEEAIDAALPGSVPESVTDTVKEKAGDLLDGTSEKVLDAFSSALEEVKQKGEEGVLTAEKSLVFAYEETRTITERNALLRIRS